ncbi:NUDIX domain-containing protein [Rhodococcus sp. NPDC058505]|uniref:NUDIX hydrolase n=1 Tax=unclassified Rhodococcus (in: high G+C Gram-positive bacteria) TaxID=192944 RepID=UPI00364C1F44
MSTKSDGPKAGSTSIKANIFAAGAVLWRKSPTNPYEIEIALIHRPKYDDWSFPKGKLDPGETPVVAALREVEEETGLRVQLGRHVTRVAYEVPGHRKRKRVDYWAAEARGGLFVPNDEVDELRWLPPEDVPAALSYPVDLKVTRRFLKVPADTTTVLLVRHAKAGRRTRYKGDDTQRPLDKVGRGQAEALSTLLRAFGATEIHAADRVRCVQTVEPLARDLGVGIGVEPALTEESYLDDPATTQSLVRKIAARGGVQVICSQGRVIPDLLQRWADRDGVTLPAARNRKGSTWVLSMSGGRLVDANHVDSALPEA